MILEHQFSVPAPLDEVWKAVLDPERVAPCMPGATLSSVDGDSFRGSVKVKLGPVSLLYKGSGEFKEKDEQARRVVLEASGKDARGSGTASATVTVTLSANGATTDGQVHTDLNITGRPAQFGRGMISEVAGKLLESFSQCLAEKLTSSGEAAAQSAASGESTSAAQQSGSGAAQGGSGNAQGVSGNGSAAGAGSAAASGQGTVSAAGTQTSGSASGVTSGTGSADSAEPLDLLDYAGDSVVKRLTPVVAGAFAVLLAVLFARRRKRSRSR